MTENETRDSNHKASFKHKKHSTMTALSKYTWELKEKQQEYKLTLLSWNVQTHSKVAAEHAIYA